MPTYTLTQKQRAELMAAIADDGSENSDLLVMLQHLRVVAPSTSLPLTEDYMTADRNEWREKAERNHLIMAAWRDRYETLRAELDTPKAAPSTSQPTINAVLDSWDKWAESTEYDALEAKGGDKADKVAMVAIDKFLKRKGMI